jgi:hypothetical protein
VRSLKAIIAESAGSIRPAIVRLLTRVDVPANMKPVVEIQQPDWAQRVLPDDQRALTPLLYAHVTPYETFRLDMNKRLAIDQEAVTA